MSKNLPQTIFMQNVVYIIMTFAEPTLKLQLVDPVRLVLKDDHPCRLPVISLYLN